MHRVSQQGKVASETTFFGWMWGVAPLVHSDCRIFDHQILWIESIVILVFMHRVSYQKEGSI